VPKATSVAQSLDDLGFRNTGTVHWNLNMPQLVEMALRRGEGQIAEGGPLVVRTGVHTGRSVNDKFIVREASSEKHIWWGSTNRAYERPNFETVKRRMLAYAQGRELFVEGVATCHVATTAERTVYGRWGDWFAWLCLLVLIDWLILMPFRRRHRLR